MSSLNDIVGRLLNRRSDRRAAVLNGRADGAGDVSALRVSRSRSRAMVRLAELAPHPRSGIGSILALSFIIGGWTAGAFVGGHGPRVLSGVAAGVGLKADDIVMTGQVETKEQEVFNALGLEQGASLVGFSAGQARARLIALPWVKDAAIRKLYPGRLTVALAEKRAMAVWQHQDRLTVVEETGAPIAKFGIADLINNRFSHLPHLVGQGAPEAAQEILPIAARYPAIAGRVESYIRVAERRWDMRLSGGVTVKMPEFSMARAFEKLNDLAQEDRLLEREISVVDMRLSDRIVLRLEPEAAKVRAELVAARLKAMKKADRKL